MRQKFFLAVIVGILAILLAMRLPKQVSSPPPKPQVVIKKANPVVIFRATKDIKEKTEITPELYKRFDTYDTDEAYIKLAGKGITSETELKNKEALRLIRASEPLTIENIGPIKPFIPKRLSEAIPEGKRAITIAVNVIQSVGGFIREGDYVDILGIFSDTNVSEPIRTILSGVQVLSIGSELPISSQDANVIQPNPKDPNSLAQASIKAMPVQQITFAVTPEEAEIITLITQSRNKVNFYLVLRSKQEMEAKLAKKAQIDKMLLEGKTVEVNFLNATREILIGGQALTKKEALEIFYGKEKDSKESNKSKNINITNVNLEDPNFNPEEIDDGYRGPRGPISPAQIKTTTSYQSPAILNNQQAERTVEMYKGIQKSIINVK